MSDDPDEGERERHLFTAALLDDAERLATGNVSGPRQEAIALRIEKAVRLLRAGPARSPEGQQPVQQEREHWVFTPEQYEAVRKAVGRSGMSHPNREVADLLEGLYRDAFLYRGRMVIYAVQPEEAHRGEL